MSAPDLGIGPSSLVDGAAGSILQSEGGVDHDFNTSPVKSKPLSCLQACWVAVWAGDGPWEFPVGQACATEV